jgi:hypothetical protein
MVPNGDAPEWVKNHPALKGVNLSNSGPYEHAGILVTKTLVFAGEGSGLFAVPPEGRVTQAIGIALTTPIYEFATHRLPGDRLEGRPLSATAKSEVLILGVRTAALRGFVFVAA